MKKMLSLLAASMVLAAGAAHAATETTPAAPKKPNRMSACAKEFKATGKEKSEYKPFMKVCMSNKKAAAK